MSFYDRSALSGNHTAVVFMWIIVAIGALNWGLVAQFEYNLVTEFVTESTADLIYIGIGAIAAVNLADIVGVVDLNDLAKEYLG